MYSNTIRNTFNIHLFNYLFIFSKICCRQLICDLTQGSISQLVSKQSMQSMISLRDQQSNQSYYQSANI